MKIAALQHRLRPSAAEDVQALADAAANAAQRGAELIVFPYVSTLQEHAAHEALLALLDIVPAGCLVPRPSTEGCGFELVAASLPHAGELGTGVLFIGDEALDQARWADALVAQPAFAVVTPGAENDLQAEAVVELALGMSDSVTGLVIVAECDGAELGEAGHGGSAIVLLGDVAAEAMAGDDVLIAEVPLPIPVPEPREPIPEVPTILKQRLASHQGRHLDMGYLADLSS